MTLTPDTLGSLTSVQARSAVLGTGEAGVADGASLGEATAPGVGAADGAGPGVEGVVVCGVPQPANARDTTREATNDTSRSRP